MSYRILYHPKVREDIELLDKKQKKAVAKAIENRLGDEPEKYGTPF
jgi:mRNA-degrading endonuclease RelE of RelBE toxin-antitoxin system